MKSKICLVKFPYEKRMQTEGPCVLWACGFVQALLSCTYDDLPWKAIIIFFFGPEKTLHDWPRLRAMELEIQVHQTYRIVSKDG